ncbi:MAG: PQQ-binding-like beta-propeller repeat protein [Myxococcales bacterium]|nr:PQQ-binding-like beta-propeller repeat protein [Myxococcales bacterium]
MIAQGGSIPATPPLPTPTEAWSYDYPAYFGAGDLRASVFGRDLVVLTKEFDGRVVIGLDAATGAVRFEVDGATAVRAGDGPLYVVGVDAAVGFTVTERAPGDGAVVRTIALAPSLPAFRSTRFALAGTTLLAITDGAVAAYDLTTGALRWRTPLVSASYLFAPVVLADRVIVVNQTTTALRLADGATLWTFAGACCSAVASPDGAHVYVRRDDDVDVELDGRGQVVRALAGHAAAATDAWVAVLGPRGLDVVPHDRAAPIWHAPAAADDGLGAIGTAGPWLTYFDGRDDTLWLQDVVGDQRVALRQAHERLVISPDASGTAPAYIGAPAVWAAPRAYVLDWALHAYEVGDGR